MSTRLSDKAMMNLKMIMTLAPGDWTQGDESEIQVLMTVIRKALNDKTTPLNIIEELLSDNTVKHVISLVGVSLGAVTMRAAGKSSRY